MSKLRVQFGRDAFAPGDTIEGVIVASERIKARDTEAELCYVDESPDYVEEVTHDASGSLRQGTLEPGVETRFVLQLPPGALPNWDPAGTARRLAGQEPVVAGRDELPSYGRLYWAIVVRVDRRLRSDVVERHPVPLNDDRSVWSGAQPSERERVKATVKRWDVAIGLERWWLRRGEELTVDVSIGKPAMGRGGLRVGLVCEATYDVETTTTTGEGQTITSRSTKTATAHEEWGAPRSVRPDAAGTPARTRGRALQLRGGQRVEGRSARRSRTQARRERARVRMEGRRARGQADAAGSPARGAAGGTALGLEPLRLGGDV